MKRFLQVRISISLLAGQCLAGQASAIGLDAGEVRRAATNAHSLFLSAHERVAAIEDFVKLVRIKGPSGQEEAVREEVQRLLIETGAKTIRPETKNQKAPRNLVMEIAGSGILAEKPAILLNAHLDTIERCTPEWLAFDARTGDFYHAHETDPKAISSFGGDDRSGVAIIVETVRFLNANYWRKDIPHRRIVLVFTAEEERGCLGAKYLTEHEPQIFGKVEISLAIDGPLDMRSRYPQDSFVAVVIESDRTVHPYKRVLDLMGEFCQRTKTGFTQTRIGLGMGDFAYFPSSAKAGLHLRSPVRGWHTKERVKVQDLINHIDLICHILLGWDQKIATDLPHTDGAGSTPSSKTK